MCVVEPVGAVIILHEFLVGAPQEPHILLVQASVPDVIKDGHLLKLATVLVRGPWYGSWGGHVFGLSLS